MRSTSSVARFFFRGYTTAASVDAPVSRVFVVQVHPNPESFSSAIADTVVSTLESKSVEVRRRDLYNMPDGGEFSPIMVADERATYFDENKQPQLTNDAHVKDIVDNLRW